MDGQKRTNEFNSAMASIIWWTPRTQSLSTLTNARTYDEVESTKTMLERTERRLNLKPKRLAADTAYGTGRFLGWLVGRGIAPHIPVRDASERDDVRSRVATSAGTAGAVSTSARTTKCCIPLALCTMAPCYATAPPNSIVMCARLR